MITSPPIDSNFSLPMPVVLFVGLGESGCNVIDKLDKYPPFGPGDWREANPMGRLRLLHSKTAGDDTGGKTPHVIDLGRMLAGQIVMRLEKMLAHGTIDKSRSTFPGISRDNTTRALVVLVADAREEMVQKTLSLILQEFQALAHERLQPIFDLLCETKNLSLLPLLISSHIRKDKDPQLANFIAGVYQQIAAQAEETRALAPLYLLESVTNLSILEDPDLEMMLENFCLFLAECSAKQYDGGKVIIEKILFSGQGNQPLGTFSATRTEMFGTQLQEYLRCRSALDVLEALHLAPIPVDGEREREEIASEVKAILVRQFPEASLQKIIKDTNASAAPRVAFPHWTRAKQVIEKQVAPDTGDPTSEQDVKGHEKAPWLVSAKEKIHGLWRDMLERRFDGILNEFRGGILEWQHGKSSDSKESLIYKLRKHCGQYDLSGDQPVDVGTVKRITRKTATMLRDIEDELAKAVAIRDQCEIPDLPSLKPLEEAHAQLTLKNRALPSWFWLIVVFAFSTFLGALLLGSSLFLSTRWISFSSGSWAKAVFHDHPYITGWCISGGIFAVLGFLIFYPRYLQVKNAIGNLNQVAEQLIVGEKNSLKAYFAGRLKHVWHLLKVGVLVQVRDTVAQDLHQLREIDRALVGAMERYKKRLYDTGVTQRADGSSDFSGLFRELREPLVWPLCTEKHLAAFFLQNKAGQKHFLTPDEVRQVINSLERKHHFFSRWRDLLPFLEDEPFDRELDALNAGKTKNMVPENEILQGQVQFSESFYKNVPISLPWSRRQHQDQDSIKCVLDCVLGESQSVERLKDEFKNTEVAKKLVGLEGLTSARIYGVRIWNGIDGRVLLWWPEGPGPAPKREPKATSGGKEADR